LNRFKRCLLHELDISGQDSKIELEDGTRNEPSTSVSNGNVQFRAQGDYASDTLFMVNRPNAPLQLLLDLA
jgi:hypothetical protein